MGTFEHLNAHFVENTLGHIVFSCGASMSVFSKEGDELSV